jgi:hypothetical protein
VRVNELDVCNPTPFSFPSESKLRIYEKPVFTVPEWPRTRSELEARPATNQREIRMLHDQLNIMSVTPIPEEPEIVDLCNDYADVTVGSESRSSPESDSSDSDTDQDNDLDFTGERDRSYVTYNY